MVHEKYSVEERLPDVGEGLDSLSEALLIVDAGGTVVFANGAFNTQSGRMKAAGLSLVALFEGDGPSLMQTLQSAGSGDWITLRLRTSDSPTRVRMRLFVERLLSSDTDATHYVLKASSSAETKLDLAMSQAETDRIRTQKSELEKNYSRLEHFSYVAAHDLRAPLRNIASVLGYFEEDYGNDIPPEAQNLLAMARTSAKRLQTLISDLLAHARSRSEAVTLRDVALKPLIQSIRDAFSESMSEAEATLTFTSRNDVMTADPLLIEQILQNLISNAIKYREPGRPLKIDIALKGHTGAERSLVVRDNGLGFEDHFAEQIFEPFQRLHSAQEIEGSGVGLATVRAVCERLNWRVSARGVLGKGAEFTISGTF